MVDNAPNKMGLDIIMRYFINLSKNPVEDRTPLSAHCQISELNQKTQQKFTSPLMLPVLLLKVQYYLCLASASQPRTIRKSDYTPALALPKHMAGIFDEKCREKEKYREEQIGECPFSIPRHNLL